MDSIESSSSNSYEFNVTTWWPNRDSDLDLVPTSCCQDATRDNYAENFVDTNCERTLLSHYNKVYIFFNMTKRFEEIMQYFFSYLLW